MRILNYSLPPSYQLGNRGCGCAGDPPNHPRYFVRSIYTRFGDSPPYERPQYELHGKYYTELEDVDKLFKPLPLEHPRVQAWIKDTFRHHQHCYQDAGKEGSWHDKIIIFPVGDWQLRHFIDDERFSDEWRQKEKASIEQANTEIQEHARQVATPDNHDATIIIRRYYPDFVPTLALIENPPQTLGNWWTTEEKQPTPENCPGQYGQHHPVNQSWCQWCGWRQQVS